MKTLVVYNLQGQLIFTQTNAIEQYNCIVEDVAEQTTEVTTEQVTIKK